MKHIFMQLSNIQLYKRLFTDIQHIINVILTVFSWFLNLLL